jgi:hypothetical protein
VIPTIPTMGVLLAVVLAAGCSSDPTPPPPTSPAQMPTPVATPVSTQPPEPVPTTIPTTIPTTLPTTAPARASTLPPAAAPVVPALSAVEVIGTGLTTMFTWDPTRDVSPADAYLRALPLLGGALADPVRAGSRNPRGPGLQWDAWKSQGAVVTAAVVVTNDEHPPDTPTAVYRVVSITQTPRAAAAVVPGTQTFTAWVTAALTPDGWRIDTLRF